MDWQKNFAKYKVIADENNPKRIISFGETPNDYDKFSAKVVLSTDLRAFIYLSGPDTEKFLQGQVTCDLSKLGHDESMNGAHLSPKGRIIFLFTATKHLDNGLLLETHHSVMEIAISSLKKYSVFFKTEISDASHIYESIILSGNNCKALLKHFDPYHSRVIGPSTFSIKLTKDYELSNLISDNPDLELAGQGYSDLLRIQNGCADVTSTTTDQFIVQMINLDAQNYISFKKGCYTGQEIVARAHYRGSVKRRMYIIELETTCVPKPGDSLVDSVGKVIGTVAGASFSNTTSIKVLAVLSVKAANCARLKFGDIDLVNAKCCALPYEIKK